MAYSVLSDVWLLPAVWAVLAAWLVLFFGRGAFWRADQRLPPRESNPQRSWPEVTAVVPARNEAEGIGACVTALLRQDYPGVLRVIVVDDQSTDGTAKCAREAARQMDASSRLEVLTGTPLPENWAGKVWAMDQGVAAAGPVPFLWFTDGDIVHGPDVLQRLVTRIEDRDLSLVSLMVMLSCRGFWERLLIPPFIFFFQMLYPFPRSAPAAIMTAGGIQRHKCIEQSRNGQTECPAGVQRVKPQSGHIGRQHQQTGEQRGHRQPEIFGPKSIQQPSYRPGIEKSHHQRRPEQPPGAEPQLHVGGAGYHLPYFAKLTVIPQTIALRP